MKLRYKYRIYPNQLQEANMLQAAGNARFIWNHFLKLNINRYETEKKFIFYYEMNKHLTQVKKSLSWLSLSYSQILQEKLRDLDQAFKNFLRRLQLVRQGLMPMSEVGFPQFKSKWAGYDSFRYTQGVVLLGNKVRLPKIGDVKIKLHRELPSKPTSTSIIHECGKWYVSFVVDKQEIDPIEINSVIGIDVNADVIALSNNELIKAPRPNRKYKKELKQKQRVVSRRQKKSKNRAKARLIYQRLQQAHVRNIRHDFLHKTSARIAKASALICVETLDIKQMKKNHFTAIAIQDSGWGYLFNMLEYKTKLIGHHYHQINQWLASSKTCNACGHKKAKLDLNTRVYECDECQVVEHRDINAACNIRDWGYQEVCGHKPGLERARVDVIFDILASDCEISSSQMKQDACASLGRR